MLNKEGGGARSGISVRKFSQRTKEKDLVKHTL